MIPLDPPPSLTERVYERVLEAIVERSLPPGRRIRQAELADTLGVSRQPVSHALHLLHREGLVAESGRRGFEVAALDGARIRRLYEVRGALDGLAARLAAGRAAEDEAGAARLEAALAAGLAAGRGAPLPRLVALDVAFHDAIHRLSGNPEIGETLRPQWPHLRRAMGAVLAELDYRSAAWAEHEAISAHVLAGEAENAARAAEAHALRAGREVAERLAAEAAA